MAETSLEELELADVNRELDQVNDKIYGFNARRTELARRKSELEAGLDIKARVAKLPQAERDALFQELLASGIRSESQVGGVG